MSAVIPPWASRSQQSGEVARWGKENHVTTVQRGSSVEDSRGDRGMPGPRCVHQRIEPALQRKRQQQ